MFHLDSFFSRAVTLWNRLPRRWFLNHYNPNLFYGESISIPHISIICYSYFLSLLPYNKLILNWVVLGLILVEIDEKRSTLCVFCFRIPYKLIKDKLAYGIDFWYHLHWIWMWIDALSLSTDNSSYNPLFATLCCLTLDSRAHHYLFPNIRGTVGV